MALSRFVSELFDFEKCRDLEIRGQGSLKVIENDTIRSGTNDLTFHSNHETISYRFRDKQRFPSKIANFSRPVYLTLPLKGFPLEFGIGSTGSKN